MAKRIQWFGNGGVLAIGVNAVGVVAIGVNAGGSLIAIGVNAGAPIALGAVNSVGLLSWGFVNALGGVGIGATNGLLDRHVGLVAAIAILIGAAVIAGRAWRPASPPPVTVTLAELGDEGEHRVRARVERAGDAIVLADRTARVTIDTGADLLPGRDVIARLRVATVPGDGEHGYRDASAVRRIEVLDAAPAPRGHFALAPMQAAHGACACAGAVAMIVAYLAS